MRNIILFSALFIGLLSCDNPESDPAELQDSLAPGKKMVDTSLILSDEKETKDNRKFGDSITRIESSFSFLNAVFDFGSSNHFNDCHFLFECDCCAGILILSKDSAFYHVSDCMGDLTITRGDFSIHEDKIHFTSDGIRIDKQYDTSKDQEDWVLVDSVTEPYKISFQIKSCNGKPLLVDDQKDYTSIASLSDLRVKDELLKLEKDGILSRFNK